MKMKDMVELRMKKLKEEIEIRDRIIDYLTDVDTDCESCPYIVNDYGCPGVNPDVPCTGHYLRYFKNEEKYGKLRNSGRTTYPVNKQWQQLALWRIVDHFLGLAPDICNYCPVENCELERRRPMVWDRPDIDVRSSYCHAALFACAVNHMRTVINGDNSERYMELFAPELFAVARESVSKERSRRAEGYPGYDLPE